MVLHLMCLINDSMYQEGSVHLINNMLPNSKVCLITRVYSVYICFSQCQPSSATYIVNLFQERGVFIFVDILV